ncbi:MAG: hypothetical protein V4801_02455 [Burkholderia gladioli]
MPTKPTTRNAIKAAIREHGPMTVQELAEELEKSIKTVGSCIASSRAGKKKHFYVISWRPQVGISGKPAGVYSLGNRADAPKPITDRKATCARYYKQNKARIKLKRGGRAITPFTSLITQITR